MSDETHEAQLADVRRAVETLAGLDTIAVDAHADRFQAVHRRLQEALADGPSADPQTDGYQETTATGP